MRDLAIHAALAASFNPRHGDRKFVSEEITSEIIRRTWIIMDRYFEYRKRAKGAKGALKAPDFPELA